MSRGTGKRKGKGKRKRKGSGGHAQPPDLPPSAPPSSDLVSSPSSGSHDGGGLVIPSSSSTTAASPERSAAPDDGDDDDSSTRYSHDLAPPPAEAGPRHLVPAAASNYATLLAVCNHKFNEFLESNTVYYEDQLRVTDCLNKFHGRSDPYTIQVSYDQLTEESSARVGLIMAKCNCENPEISLLPAAHKFVSKFLRNTHGYANEQTTITGTRLSFSRFPKSMQMLEDFVRNCDLVQHVDVFPSQNQIFAPTVHGRFLIEALMVCLFSKKTWDGNFTSADVMIIKRSEVCLDGTTLETYEMKILKEPVNHKGEKLRAAMVKDLRKAAEIFIPFYLDPHTDVLPVYFDQLKQDMEESKKAFVDKDWFMKYLCYHVAIMPSTGRRAFEVSLHTTITSCAIDYRGIKWLASKPTIYIDDWRKLVKSAEKDGAPSPQLSSDSEEWLQRKKTTEKKGKHIDVLRDVYCHDNNPTEVRTDKYENKVSGLIKFKRNLLQHGGQKRHTKYLAELELWAAEKFSDYLPWLMRTLLEQGLMASCFEEAWADFRASQANKSETWSI